MDIYIDTGGTFTDSLAYHDGVWKRLKVLSNSALRFVCAQVQDHQLQLASVPDIQLDVVIGYELFELASNTLIGKITSVQIATQTVTLDRICAPSLCNHVVELRSREEVPVFAARLLTGTRLLDPLPPLQLRLATTKGTNALLERKGAPPILLISRGFKDLPIIGTQQRSELFSLEIKRPPPLFQAVIEVDPACRNWNSIEQALRPFLLHDSGTPIAIALKNSYKDPSDEQFLYRAVRELGFTYISTSSDLAPLIRLLPRTQTTIVDAYLAPILHEYLANVTQPLAEAPLLVMNSAGGLERPSEYRPKDSLLSGPAAGVKGVEAIGAWSERTRLISFDMGGTSTDVCRLDGKPELRFEHHIGDATVFTPLLAIETVAAGGGSICYLEHEELRVGPESAGAYPGPACYGAGGPLTITDVNLLLGRLFPSGFGIPLDVARAQEALDKLLGDAAISLIQNTNTSPNPNHLAYLDTWLQLANERMADAIRRISIRKGYDPSEYTLVSFGGAGGQHACAVSRLLGIRSILFPLDAGLLSAWGLQGAVREKTLQYQLLQPLKVALPEIRQRMQRIANDDREDRFRVDRVLLGMRFKGTDSVEWIHYEEQVDPETAFKTQFERIYGFVPDREIEVESCRMVLRAEARAFQRPEPYRKPSGQALRTQRMRYGASWIDTPVYQRSDLPTFAELEGPLLVIDPYSTLVVDPGWNLIVREDGLLEAVDRQKVELPPMATGSLVAQLSLDAARLQTIALEMGEQLQRTSLSVNVKERLDFSCAILDPKGYLVVNAPHIPVHLGAMGKCVRAVLNKMCIDEGDVVVTNHPGFGGSHLPDVTVITGVFNEQGIPLGFVANRAHHAEMGGLRPGSMPPRAQSLIEEGVVIPPTKIFVKGVPQWDVIHRLFIAGPYPSRNPKENEADLLAAVAANRLGAQRLIALSKRLGTDELLQSMQALYDHASRRMKQEIDQWDWTTRSATEHLDDGSRLQVHLEKTPKGLNIDFTGSSPVHPGNLNATPAIVHSVVMYAIRTLFSDTLPLNEGLLDVIDLHIPESLLSPRFDDDPAMCPAVVGGNVETSQRLVDTLLKAFDRVACSQGTMNNVLFGNDHFGYYETICGGSGAGPGFHGCSAVHTHMTNTRITDPEIMEWRYPVVVEQFQIRQGSGGDGMYKGGDGVIRKLRFTEPVELSILTQHRKIAPYGIRGGKSGKTGRQYIERKNSKLETLEGIDQSHLDAGEALIIETPGGGGYGKP